MSVQLFGRDQINVTFEERSTSALRRLIEAINFRITATKDRIQEILDNVTHLRIQRVSIVHWVLLAVWTGLLLSLTTTYAKLYGTSALLATMCSNVLLFGLSDILAQGIQCYLSYSGVPLGVAVHPIGFMPDVGEDSFPFDTDSDNDSTVDNDDLSMFNDYGSPNPYTQPRHLFETDDAPETHIFDFHRWVCFMFWGFILSFFQVPWYKFLNYFYTEDPSIIQVFERLLSDQLLYSPISLYCFFTYSNYIMESGDSITFARKIQRLFISTLGYNYMVWPLVQLINFSIVPKHLQVPFSSSVGIVWNCFLSMRNKAG